VEDYFAEMVWKDILDSVLLNSCQWNVGSFKDKTRISKNATVLWIYLFDKPPPKNTKKTKEKNNPKKDRKT